MAEFRNNLGSGIDQMVKEATVEPSRLDNLYAEKNKITESNNVPNKDEQMDDVNFAINSEIKKHDLSKGPLYNENRKFRLDMINPNEYRVSQDLKETGSQWDALRSFDNEQEARNYFDSTVNKYGSQSKKWLIDSIGGTLEYNGLKPYYQDEKTGQILFKDRFGNSYEVVPTTNGKTGFFDLYKNGDLLEYGVDSWNNHILDLIEKNMKKNRRLR